MGLIWSYDIDPPQSTISGAFAILNSCEKFIDLNSCERITLNKPEDLERAVDRLVNDVTSTSLDKTNKIIKTVEYLTEQSEISEELKIKYGKIIEKLNSINNIYQDIRNEM